MSLLCAICRESLGVVGFINKSCTLPCGHVFHDHCVFNWLERSRTCPHCRVSARPEQVIKLYFDVAEESQALEIESLKGEVHHLRANLEKAHNDLKSKADDCKAIYRQSLVAHKANENLRKEARILNAKMEKLKAMKEEYSRQKNELKVVLAALEKEKTKCSQLSTDIKKYQKIKALLDGSLVEASNIVNSEECIDYETMKVCFITMKRDFKTLTEAEAKLKTDFSSLFSHFKALERSNSALVEKCSIQERIIETYKADLRTSPNASLAAENSFESRMDVDENNPEPNPAKKVVPRRSPRNLNKRAAVNFASKISTSKQLSYDGLGGHSAEDNFPSAKLRPCRIVSNRRK